MTAAGLRLQAWKLLLVLGALLAIQAPLSAAANLDGLWGSALYRVELKTSGTALSGTFTQPEQPQARAGTIEGQLSPDGTAVTATWTLPTDHGDATFNTWLTLGARGAVLTGYRWTDEAPPTSFALHRAIKGEVPAVLSEDTSGDTSPGGGQSGTATTGTSSQPSGGEVDVVICERAVDGLPQNPGETFTAPKSIVALIHYRNLPENSQVDWVWTLDGRPEAKLTKTLSGNGWHTHGLKSETAIIPGTYLVTVSLNGRRVAERTVTVRGKAESPAGGTTAGADKPASQPNLEVITCESATDTGEPVNRGTSFTKPKSLVCLVRHRALPANSQLKWVWTRGGSEVARHEKTVQGTGWAWHGLSNPDGLTAGAYEVALYAAGALVTRVQITVR